MNWVTIIFSMASSACLLTALIHLFIWSRRRDAWEHLLFALAALGTASVAWCDLAMCHAASPAEFSTAARWIQPCLWLTLIPLALFVRLYLSAGRTWLLLAFLVMRTAVVGADFTTGQNLNFLEITDLHKTAWLGEIVSSPIGRANPWMWLGQLSNWVFLAYVADAAFSAWRRVEPRPRWPARLHGVGRPDPDRLEQDRVPWVHSVILPVRAARYRSAGRQPHRSGLAWGDAVSRGYRW